MRRVQSWLGLVALLSATSGCVGSDFASDSDEGEGPDAAATNSPIPTSTAPVPVPVPVPVTDAASPVTDARVDAAIECGSDAECDNGTWCDGEETCSDDGLCEAGVPPGDPSDIACVRRVCNEQERLVSYVPDDSLCDAPVSRCDEDVVVSASAQCNPQTGCEVIEESEPCDVGAAASCDQSLLTRVTRGCRVQEGVARCVDIQDTETCDAPAVCRGDLGLTHVAPAQCDESAGACVAEETPCVAPEATCEAGVLTTYESRCDAAAGCSAESESRTCPAASPRCSASAASRVVFEPACDGSSCLQGGRPVEEACEVNTDRCEDGSLTTFSASCSGGECRQESATEPCEVRRLGTCLTTGGNLQYTPVVPSCSSSVACNENGSSGAIEICEPIATCEGNVWVGQRAECTRRNGCGVEQQISEIDCADRSTGPRCRLTLNSRWEVVETTCKCSITEGPCVCETNRLERCFPGFGCSNGKCDSFLPPPPF